MLIEETVQGWLIEKFSEESFRSFFIVDVKYHSHRLEIFLDSDENLNLDMCGQISRWLGNKIEESNLIDEHYILEVSSSGLDRPLKLHRQYVKNKGRFILIHLKDGSQQEGILQEVEPESITVHSEIIEKEGKKKVKKQIDTKINFDDILKTFIQVKF